MDAPVAMPSPQLAEANRRLHALRRQSQAVGVRSSSRRAPCATLNDADDRSSVARRTPSIAALPPHLGWGSDRLTAVVRAARQRKARLGDSLPWEIGPPSLSALSGSKQTFVSSKPLPSAAAVKVYPSIALGMLREEMAASGRIWLLARHLDGAGRGVLRVANLRETLTSKSSPLRVCGWRQLRNLLRQGEGVFWRRDKTRLWLHSAAKAAYALGVTQLNGRPVAVPIEALTGGVGDVRAHLYASFHSGRTRENRRGGLKEMPIARDTLTAVSGVGRVSQRNYEARTQIRVSYNFAVGEAVDNKEKRENRLWQRGAAAFELKDYRGQQGRKGKTYLAWQLPNGYSGTHRQRPLGRQKRINRELKDLVMKGMPGNVEGTGDALSLDLAKRYYPNGKLAAKSNGRAAAQERYWPGQNSRIWQTIGEV